MPWHNTGALAAAGGANYQYYRQDQLSSCGRAAVLTLIYYIKNKQLTPTIVGRWFKEVEGSSNVGHDGIRDFDNTGSGFGSLIGVLGKQDISASSVYNPEYIERRVRGISRAHPGVLSVGWYQQTGPAAWVRNGGHWVIALEIIAGQIICLDPDLNNAGNTTPLTTFPAAPNTAAANPAAKYGAYQCNYGGGVRTGYIDGFLQT